MSSATALREEMSRLEATITGLRNQRDALHTFIWSKVKRVRAGVKGTFGDDSSQYEMAGGTRLSERKKTAWDMSSQGDFFPPDRSSF